MTDQITREKIHTRTITLDGYDGTALASASPILHDKAQTALAL